MLVWAWGDLGHKIVCQIAFQELNDKAHCSIQRWGSSGIRCMAYRSLHR